MLYSCGGGASKLLLLLLLWAANFWSQVESKAVFGIGTRIAGDQLLMKDILKTPTITLTEEPVIKFNYAIPQPITYIEMISEKNIYGTVDFSYENDLVAGTIRRQVPGIISGLGQHPEPFEVLIQIYGFNDTQPNVNPAYILNKEQQINGILKPNDDRHQPQDALSLMKEDSVAIENLNADNEYDLDGEPVDDDDGDDDEDDDDYDDEDYEEESLNSSLNKFVELGNRQEGDSLLYETYQTSSEATENPTNHTVVFYYIDVDFITFVKFTIFDHYLDNPLTDYRPPLIEFEKISPHSLKAIVTDQHTTSLFVQMQIYGYKPTKKPVAFQSYLTSGQASIAASSSVNAAANDLGDVEYVTVQLPVTEKKRMHVHFNGADCNNGAGQLITFNWLSTIWMTLTVAVICRQFLY